MTANSVSSVVPALQSTGLGVPLSYQRTATRTNLNPPPAQSAVPCKNDRPLPPPRRVWRCDRNRSYGERVAVWRNWRKVPGAPCRWPKKLRRSMKYLHPEESLQILIVVLVASVLHRSTTFLRSAICTPGTFLWFRQTATCPPLQAVSSTPLDPSWWWRRLVVLVRPAHSAQAEGWNLSLSPLVSAISNQVSRCCINFPDELTCQLLTNQNIKIRRRAWPTRDPGEKGQKQLLCL